MLYYYYYYFYHDYYYSVIFTYFYPVVLLSLLLLQMKDMISDVVLYIRLEFLREGCLLHLVHETRC